MKTLLRIDASIRLTADHTLLASKISALQKPWVLTYDNEPAIVDLYKTHRKREFNLNYFAQTKRVGTELMIFSDNFVIPSQFLSVA